MSAKKKYCCGCDSANCENNTGCADGSPTVLTSCTYAKIASNRLVATVSGSAAGTVTISGLIQGESMDWATLDWEVAGIEVDISWSGSVAVDVRRIVHDDSYEVATPVSFDYYYGGPAGSGSCTWSIDWGTFGAPPDWTEVEDLGVVVSGGAGATGSGDTLNAGGMVVVSRAKRFSFTDGINPTVYYVVLSCGGIASPGGTDTTTGNGDDICAGDSVAISYSGSTAGIAAFFDEESPVYTSQSESISGEFKRETDVSGDIECGSCERAFILEMVVSVVNANGDSDIRTSTGRFIQQCPTEKCAQNSCLWAVDGDGFTWERVRTIDGTTTTTTGTSGTFVIIAPVGRFGDDQVLWEISNSGAAMRSFYAGECPTEDPTPYNSPSYSYFPDGTTEVTTTTTLTFSPSSPAEDEPVCYCDAYTAYDTGEVTEEGVDLKWEVEDANESGTFIPAVVETDNPFLTFYAVPRLGAAWVGIDEHGTAYSGIRTYKTRFRVSTPRDLRIKIASDNQSIAVLINSTVVATDATPSDTTSHEQKHLVHLPATPMVAGWNDIEIQVEDLGEVSGFLWEWQRH